MHIMQNSRKKSEKPRTIAQLFHFFTLGVLRKPSRVCIMDKTGFVNIILGPT